MKHFKTYLLCLGLALTTASCSQDDFDSTEATSEKLVEMSFIAGSSQPVTRTVLGSDGATVTWQTNDKIGIGFKGYQPKNYPFTTPTAGSDVRFWGNAQNQPNPYFMMYPYQQDAKISANNNTQATYEYNFPKEQNAIAGTFDPKANVSVGIIPQRGKPFIAYNVGGLLRFTIKGTSDVKQVKLLSIGQENLAGNLKSTITFANDGKISAAQNQFSSASPVVNFKAESGNLEENKAYYIALPEQKLSQGLTLVFIMQDGKAILKKVKQEINIQRAKVYDLGEMTLDETKAKAFILKNQGLIEAVGAKVSGGLTTTADGHLDIYAADNLEKILSFKGILPIANNDKLTSFDELQYYRNVTGLNLSGNQNLAGNLDLSKYKQLTEDVTITGSPNVSKVDLTGLDVQNIDIHSMNGMKEVIMKDNNNLKSAKLYSNGKLENVDASNLPELRTLWTQGSGSLKTINTANTPNLKELNASSDGNLTGITGLQDNVELTTFTAPYTKLTKLNFSNAPKLRSVNLVSSSVTEIKGLSAAGANLQELQLSQSHVGSLDISNNPNLTKLDLYYVTEMSALDVTHNPNLTYLRTTFLPLTTLDLSNNTKLVELSIAHNKLSSLDIRHMPNLAKFYAGSQSPNGLANITVTMTAAQKAKLEQVKPFLESANDNRANFDDTNSWVKVVVAP